ncbi:galactoside ABC transporter permease [Treponema sp.]|uniref:galactose/methyl galactoside ABC transporter permease MglC n=1 Tax=Treponema sp. TaxID=166 RepID=UPI0025E5FEE1|nr:galactoside ABC transporter permease [Treponema sp.]MCR5218680.1 galactoside ABC transporter permease [Treponema sp.]
MTDINIEELKKLAGEKLEELKSVETVASFSEDETLKTLHAALDTLRNEGVNKVIELKQKITSAKKNKMLSSEERASFIAEQNSLIEKANVIARQNEAADKELSAVTLVYANALAEKYIAQVNAEEDAKIAEAKKEHADNEAKIKADFGARIASCKTEQEKNTAAYELKSALFDAKNHAQTIIDRCKDAKKQAFTDHVQENRAIRNGKTSFKEDIALSFKNYIYSFKLSKFLLENGLYLAIALFFIVCIIYAPLHGSGNLLTLPNILTILEQSSTRMFYALGVAGLILIAGTDLSVGRMVAMGSVITGLILHPGTNIVKVFGLGPWNFTSYPMAGRLGLALVLSIVLCVAFSVFAGFFTAKLKIHPFISTLATQLIIYGLLFFGTDGTPVGGIDPSVKDLIGGRWVLGFINGELITIPKLIIPAIIAVIVAWFIWNKTTFGKNMYAVGGNAEAAAVSGISVFKTTLLIFVMAGIFYGCGAFLEAFRANASAGTGQGYEMDAIAACVVGGISFNGGIGKIGGAAIGVIIFTSLTYCLTFLQIDTNLQFIFKGLIIIAAVALDSVKYLKRK